MYVGKYASLMNTKTNKKVTHLNALDYLEQRASNIVVPSLNYISRLVAVQQWQCVYQIWSDLAISMQCLLQKERIPNIDQEPIGTNVFVMVNFKISLKFTISVNICQQLESCFVTSWKLRSKSSFHRSEICWDFKIKTGISNLVLLIGYNKKKQDRVTWCKYSR